MSTPSDNAGIPIAHTPVLAREVQQLLAPQPGQVYVDLTAGLGGHASLLAKRLEPGGKVVLFDLDAENLTSAGERVSAAAPTVEVSSVHANFTQSLRTLQKLGLRADMLLADLGFASNQMDDAERGFSFQRDGPLDMRLDPTAPLTAADLVNDLPETELADLIFEFGEDRLSRKIARILVAERKREPIRTTARLASLVRRAYGRQGGRQRIDAATRTFQALRIAVNDEIENLRVLLEQLARSVSLASSSTWLAADARIAFISFHSLEDRLVKRAFADMVDRGAAEMTARKPITADPEEISDNARARSAKLRVVRLTGRSGDDPPATPVGE